MSDIQRDQTKNDTVSGERSQLEATDAREIRKNTGQYLPQSEGKEFEAGEEKGRDDVQRAAQARSGPSDKIELITISRAHYEVFKRMACKIQIAFGVLAEVQELEKYLDEALESHRQEWLRKHPGWFGIGRGFCE